MKVTCVGKHLTVAVSTVERFTSRHITLPILSNILFQTKERALSLIATNLELGIEYTIPAKVQKPGAATAPARPLTQALAAFEGEVINIESRDQHLCLKNPTTNLTFFGQNPSDFPTIPSIKPEFSFTIPASVLVPALERILPACATSALKPEFSGVLFKSTANSLTLAATDSFRLAEQRINDTSLRGSAEAIIPARTLEELIRIVPAEADIVVSVGEHQIVCTWNGKRILSRLIDGAYPPYQNIIPSSFETTITARREDLLRMIRLASVFTSRLNDVTLRFGPTELIISTAGETGETSSRLAVKGRGASSSSVFNHRFLSDGLAAAGGEEVVISLNGVSGPARIQNPADPSYFYLLMPIRAV